MDFSKRLGTGNVLLEQAKLMSIIYEVIVNISCNVVDEINPGYEWRCKKAHIRYIGMTYPITYKILIC